MDRDVGHSMTMYPPASAQLPGGCATWAPDERNAAAAGTASQLCSWRQRQDMQSMQGPPSRDTTQPGVRMLADDGPPIGDAGTPAAQRQAWCPSGTLQPAAAGQATAHAAAAPDDVLGGAWANTQAGSSAVTPHADTQPGQGRARRGWQPGALDDGALHPAHVGQGTQAVQRAGSSAGRPQWPASLPGTLQAAAVGAPTLTRQRRSGLHVDLDEL